MSGLMLDQLPVVMATDTGVAKFLDVVDPMASQLYDVVGAKEVFFDPTVAPLPVVRWLGVRLGVEIDSNLPDDVQRRVFMIAAATHAIRGTAESLRMNLAAITGGVVSIEEHGTIESLPTPQHPPSPQPPSPPSGSSRAPRAAWAAPPACASLTRHGSRRAASISPRRACRTTPSA